MSSFAKLIKHPHRAVFDITPDPRLAFTIDAPVGLVRWQVIDWVFSAVVVDDTTVLLDVDTGVLAFEDGSVLNVYNSAFYNATIGSVSVGPDGYVVVSYPLAGRTIGSLISDLLTDGFIVGLTGTSDILGLSAYALVDGIGISTQPVTAYTSLLWVFLKAFSFVLDDAKVEVFNALLQMDLNTSDGEWLDLWGELFNVARLQEEQLDVNYRTKIKNDVFRKRLNKYSIEAAILDITGKVVEIEEMFIYLFRLDSSRLSSTARFGDGKTVGAFLIRAVSSIVIDWTDVMAVIHKNRAAGIVVLPPIVR